MRLNSFGKQYPYETPVIMVKWRRELLTYLLCLYTFCCIVYYFVCLSGISATNGYETSAESSADATWTASLHRRQLLSLNDSLLPNPIVNGSSANCTRPDIEQFPRPMMDYTMRRKGGLLIHIFVALYMFLGLAILCDEYFVPSMEKMCKLLHMQSDVAGATFMAAGSSAPELATSVIAVFIAKDDIGIGTVVGSAVFNIAFVIGICGLFAGRVIYLNGWPMFRDCIFYLISILALLFALRNENVTWVESILFLSLYIVYILFMFINHRVEAWMMHCLGSHPSLEVTNGVTYHPLSDRIPGTSENAPADIFMQSAPSEYLPSIETSFAAAEVEQSSVFTPPSGNFLRKGVWLASLPLLTLCFFTVPDCRKQRWERWFFATFLMSCIWIGLLSYVLVWMITIIGYTLHIRDTIMGLTFLAAGASIPDAISSLLVVRDGFGDMAVSNAVGSNVFDILLCLGLPWFLQTVVVEPGSTIPVRSRGLAYSTLTLLLTVIFLLLATHMNGWKLDRRYGCVLLTWYGLFMIVATLYESNLFGNTDQPTCPSEF